MTPEQLGQFLDELGKRLGPAGDHVYQLAIRQVVISNAVGLAVAVAIFAFTFFGVRFVWRRARDADSTDEGFLKVISSIGAIFGFLIGVIWAGTCLVSLLNPEYAALRDILSAIGGVK
jgi:hypothetical protein